MTEGVVYMWTVTVTLLMDTGFQIDTVNKCLVDSEALGIGGFNATDILQYTYFSIPACV